MGSSPLFVGGRVVHRSAPHPAPTDTTTMSKISLPVPIRPQPDGRSCGPTCLEAVYAYHGDAFDLNAINEGIPQLDTGGTLAVQLGCHALTRGYRADLYTLNLQLFDPTWFRTPRPDLAERLQSQAKHKLDDDKLVYATEHYLRYLTLGGRVHHEVLDATLIHRMLVEGLPILTGLSATFLYNESREYGDDDLRDDLRGLPVGHFVVICGIDRETGTAEIADPWPHEGVHRHSLPYDRLACAILLGVLTYDANLLVLSPQR